MKKEQKKLSTKRLIDNGNSPFAASQPIIEYAKYNLVLMPNLTFDQKSKT